MKNIVAASMILLIVIALGGCSKRNTVGLDVDLYVHPTSADPLDIILQTAITKRLNDSAITKLSLIHVRVQDGVVILTGTATEKAKNEAKRIAEKTKLTLSREDIAPEDIVPKAVTDRITIK